jgi:hypothetical protein
VSVTESSTVWASPDSEPLVHRAGQQQALGRCRVAEGVDRRAHDRAQIDRDRVELELGGLDLREVQDVVDDLQQ